MKPKRKPNSTFRIMLRSPSASSCPQGVHHGEGFVAPAVAGETCRELRRGRGERGVELDLEARAAAGERPCARAVEQQRGGVAGTAELSNDGGAIAETAYVHDHRERD